MSRFKVDEIETSPANMRNMGEGDRVGQTYRSIEDDKHNF